MKTVNYNWREWDSSDFRSRERKKVAYQNMRAIRS